MLRVLRLLGLAVLGLISLKLSLAFRGYLGPSFPELCVLPLPFLFGCTFAFVVMRVVLPAGWLCADSMIARCLQGSAAGLLLFAAAVVMGSNGSAQRWLVVAVWMVCFNAVTLILLHVDMAIPRVTWISRRGRLRLLAAALGAVICLLLVGASEFACSRLLARQSPGPNKVYSGGYLDAGAFFRQDPELGIALEPDRSVVCRLTVDERPVWDVRYSTDQFGRRRTLFPGTRVPRATAVFFGCSFLFGEGSNDDETIPSRFCKAQPDFVAVNYGVPGWGTQHMLALLQSQTLKSQVVAPVRLGIYLYLPEVHEARVVGDMDIINGFGAGFPCFELDSAGQLARLGTFASARPLTVAFYGLLGKSSTRAFLGLNFPRRSVQHYLLTAAIIERSKELFLTQFPDSRFLVVAYPHSVPETLTLKTVRAKGLEVLNLTDLFDPSDPDFQHVGDGHPTPAANAAVATAIAQHLQNP